MADKMKCAQCGKRFKQGNKKQVLCGDCLAKERAGRKNRPQLVPSSGVYSQPASPRRQDMEARPSGITIVQATPPPEVVDFGARARAEQRVRQESERPPQPASTSPTPRPAAAEPAPKPKQPAPPVRVAQTPKKAAQPEKRARQPRTTTPPFHLTDEARAAIEQRYLELSQPVEFDGIRTRIATELSIPKPVVKQVIRELRVRRQLPSWWELQAYKGSNEDLERIRARYLPLLPVPPIGVHKQIATDLNMDAPQVYQAIRRLRAEMKLPQYNPPESHGDETSGGQSQIQSGDGIAAATVSTTTATTTGDVSRPDA